MRLKFGEGIAAEKGKVRKEKGRARKGREREERGEGEREKEREGGTPNKQLPRHPCLTGIYVGLVVRLA